MAKISHEVAARKTNSPAIDLGRLTGIRRGPSPLVRDLTTGSDAARPTGFEGQAFGSGRAWLVAALANIAILLAVAFGVVLGPPLVECRRQAELGFFSGATFSGCMERATDQRLTRLESQLSMILRGSGH